MQDARVVLSTLLDLTNRANKGLSLDEILQLATDVAIRLMPADHVSVRVFNTNRTELVCRARAGAGKEAPPVHLKSGEGILGWVVEKGYGAHVRDTRQDKRFKVAANQGFSVRSMLAVPLVVSGRVLGVLALSAGAPQAFSADDEVLAQLLGSLLIPYLNHSGSAGK